ncbi:hypothetical protein IMY05_C4238002100 [Salix suchowensis]|nr:hypothetical protein IMY05_C4238002100 [Salix suchowensis]
MVVDPANSGDSFLQSCTHYRTTLVTVRPPMALEQLISQLKSRQAINIRRRPKESSNVKSTIDDRRHGVCNRDRLVSESWQCDAVDARDEGINHRVTSNDSQWAGVLSVREDDEAARQQPPKEIDAPVEDDDIYAYGDDPLLLPKGTGDRWSECTSISIGRKYTVHNDTSHLQPGRGDPGLKLKLHSCSIPRFDDVARGPKGISDHLTAIPPMSASDAAYLPQSTFTRIANSSSMPPRKPRGSHYANWYCFGLGHVARNAQ